jgi:manganese efflux pump family protein
MDLPSILALSVGLAMDATAVSAARGLCVTTVRPRHVALVAAYFGGAQALMPLLGWQLGHLLGGWVSAWDHWIACGLLTIIGGKMCLEARKGPEEAPCDRMSSGDPFAHRLMIALAIATSIDAFAVGITLPLLKAPLVLTLVAIGLTTALLSAAGLFAGRRFGAALGRRMDAVGGIVLIVLGIKILVEHLRGG